MKRRIQAKMNEQVVKDDLPDFKLLRKSTIREKGIVQFSETSFLLRPGEQSSVGSGRVGVSWESLDELSHQHGHALIADILRPTGLLCVGRGVDEALEAVVLEVVTPKVWGLIEDRCRGLGADQRFAFFSAMHAELHEEMFGEVWLAAMAQHADAEGNAFAFGYLVAQLDAKRRSEVDFLRGRVSLESASRGGQARSEKSASRREGILAEMKSLQEDGGHSKSRAAQLAYRKGLGSSWAANIKMWDRHTIK